MKSCKKLLCLILSIVLVAGIMPIVKLKTDAAQTVYTSKNGQWQYIKQSDTRLSRFNGSTQSKSAKLMRYLGDDENVVIPEEIDGLKVFIIGEKCFYGDKTSDEDTTDIETIDAIKSITIGPDIYEVGNEAFAYMDSLEEIIFSDTVPTFSDSLVLKDKLFNESKKLVNIEFPAIKEYDGYSNLFEGSYIKTVTAPDEVLNCNFSKTRIEHLTVTGQCCVDTYLNSFSSEDSVMTVEFTDSTLLSDIVFQSNYNSDSQPDLFFRHIPSQDIQRNLCAIGYIKQYDYDTGIMSFSVNNSADTKYMPITERLESGIYYYSLTEDDNAVIIGYRGRTTYSSVMEIPAEIEGHKVIAIQGTYEKFGKRYDILGNRYDIADNRYFMESIVIPEGVEYIGEEAFRDWYSLINVSFPQSLKAIDSRAFSRCYNLKEAILPNNLVYLGCEAFLACSSLEKIVIPGSLKEISNKAFCRNKTNTPVNNSHYVFEDLIIQDGVETIGDSAFCMGTPNSGSQTVASGYQYSLELPSTIKYIGEYAFFNNNIDEGFAIPTGVETICYGAFAYSNFTESITLCETLKYIDERAFENCTIKECLIIPGSVVKIGYAAFSCLTAPEIILPSAIKVLPMSCFQGSQIDRLIIPEGIKVISNGAFSQISVDELIVPSSVLYCDRNAFEKSKINNLSYSGKPISGISFPSYIFYGAVINNLSFTEGTAIIGDNTFNGAKIYRVSLDGISTIRDRAFYGCSDITELTIPESISSISASAFSGCIGIERITFNAKKCVSAPGLLKGKPKLREITICEDIEYIPERLFEGYQYLDDEEEYFYKDTYKIPQSVKRIYDYAFYGSNFAEVNLPDNLEYIGKYCFAGCDNLETVTIPEKVNTIGTGAFSHCASLKTVNFLPIYCNIEESDVGIFGGCDELENFNFGESNKYIPDYLFKGLSNIESVSLPDSVTDIGSYTFANTNLKSVVIPGNVESIGDGCFENCKELENIVINGKIFLIGDNAFGGCDKIREIYIADSVKDIGRTSFAGCTSLETVYMSRNVVYIPNRCFENCTALNSFTWEADSKLIGKLAFAECTSLTTFNFVGIEKLYPNSFKGSGIGVASLGEAQDEAAAALEIVEAQSFMDCPKLQTVALGGNVSTVQTKAFANCENLETAIISDSVETISSDAFENCPKLTIYCSEDSYAYNYAKANNISVSTFVVAPIPNQRYTGKELEPAVSVTVSGSKLSKGDDFKVKYSDNINVGNATVKVSGINTYKMFTSTVSFVILTRDISEAEIKDIDEQKFTGSAVTPKVRVTYNGKILREGTDYNVVYSNNTSVGTAKATLTGIGNFSGTAKTEFSIVESNSPITPPWHGRDEDPEEPETPPDNPSEPGDTPGDDSGDNGNYIMRVLSWFTDTLIPFVFRMLSAVISLLMRT